MKYDVIFVQAYRISEHKDVRLPIRFIRSATVDGGDGCSIRNVYGTDSSIYREDVVKKIHAPKKV